LVVKKLGLAAVTTCLVFLAAEVALRLLLPLQVDVPHLRVYPQGFYTWYPGARFTYHNLAGVIPSSAEIRINDDGLRGGPIPASGPEDQLRVLVLGDSFTAGVQLPEAEIFTTRLGEQLQQSRSGGVVVMNAGFNGAGTAQQLLYLIYRGLDLEPDIVVLQATDNDLDDNLAQSGLSLGPDGLTASRRAVDPPVWLASALRVRDWLGNRSLVFYLGYRSIKRLSARVGTPVVAAAYGASGAAATSSEGDAGARLFAALAGEIVDAANDVGAPVVLFSIPDALHLSAEGERSAAAWRLLQERLRASSASRHDRVDVREALLAAQGRGEQAYLAGDGHLGPPGHRAVADVLGGAILALAGAREPVAQGARAQVARQAALARLRRPRDVRSPREIPTLLEGNGVEQQGGG
jgi:lysophospholipase L1-like esterase